MAKQTWVNVGGIWKQVKDVWLKENGEWKNEVVPKGKVGGSWKEFITYSIFPPYLFLHGNEGVEWVVGYREGDPNRTRGVKQDGQLLIETDEINVEFAWVTDTMIDLSNYNSIKCTGVMIGNSGQYSEEFTKELYVSQLLGDFYIRLHLKAKSFFGSQSSEWYIIASTEKDGNGSNYDAKHTTNLFRTALTDSMVKFDKIWLE